VRRNKSPQATQTQPNSFFCPPRGTRSSAQQACAQAVVKPRAGERGAKPGRSEAEPRAAGCKLGLGLHGAEVALLAYVQKVYEAVADAAENVAGHHSPPWAGVDAFQKKRKRTTGSGLASCGLRISDCLTKRQRLQPLGYILSTERRSLGLDRPKKRF
jgi:hypothetical protein